MMKKRPMVALDRPGEKAMARAMASIDAGRPRTKPMVMVRGAARSC